MILDYSTPGKLRIDITNYIETIISYFPEQIGDKAKTPQNERLFTKINKNAKGLNIHNAKLFHTYAIKIKF